MEPLEAQSMILRISAKLGDKIGVTPTETLPLGDNPYLDWTGRLFRSGRVQYVLLTNTASLYPIVFAGRGLTTPTGYAERVARELEALRASTGSARVGEGLFLPADAAVLFSKTFSRSVTGSMNEQVMQAQAYLETGSKTTLQVAEALRRMPMLSLEAVFPFKAFEALTTGSHATTSDTPKHGTDASGDGVSSKR